MAWLAKAMAEEEIHMPRNYFRAGVRVVILAALMTALMILSRPQEVFASSACEQCVSDCARTVRACIAECKALGEFGCEEACSPEGGTCLQQCTDEGLCP